MISTCQATLPPFTLMLANRLLEGASHLIVVVAASTLIAHVSPDRYRAQAMTLWGTFFGVAFAPVAWFGLPLASAQGFACLFAVHPLVMALVAILLLVILPRERHVCSDTSALTLRSILQRHTDTYRSAQVAAPAMGWRFYTLSIVSLITILSDYVPVGERALVSGSIPLASIASSMTLGGIPLCYMGAVQVVMLDFAASLQATIFLWLFPGSVAGCIVLFITLGLVHGANFAAVRQLNKDDQSRAYANGALAQLGNLGNLRGTPLLLLTANSLQFHGMMLFAAICYVFGIAVHAIMHLRRQEIPRQST
jgi:DHA1 family inner membrane transport protein